MRISIAGATAGAIVGTAFAQPPPDCTVDRNVVRTQCPLAAEDCGAAHAELGANITMPERHDREVPDGFRFKYPQWLSLQQADDQSSGPQLPRTTHPYTAIAVRATGRRQDFRNMSLPHSRSGSCSRSKLSGHWPAPTRSTSVGTRLASRASSSRR